MVPKGEHAPTIPEEDESGFSSYHTGRKNNFSSKIIESPVIQRSEYTALKDSSPLNGNKTDGSVKEDNKVSKLKNLEFQDREDDQRSPVPHYRKLNDSTPKLNAVGVFIQDNSASDQIDEEVEEQQKPLDRFQENKSKEATPKIGNDDSLIYFESKDPDPKQVKPVGGTGPALTKTLVKPKFITPVSVSVTAGKKEQPVDDYLKDEELIEDFPESLKDEEEIPGGDLIESQDESNKRPSKETTESPEIETEEEQLRKLEEEVEKLQKEAESATPSVFETEAITEQSYIVDGKKKRK
jgi:hypothetical protein